MLNYLVKIAHGQTATTTLDPGELITDFIAQIVDLLQTNLPIVLGFMGAILVWGVLKKYVFGGTRKL